MAYPGTRPTHLSRCLLPPGLCTCLSTTPGLRREHSGRREGPQSSGEPARAGRSAGQYCCQSSGFTELVTEPGSWPRSQSMKPCFLIAPVLGTSHCLQLSPFPWNTWGARMGTGLRSGGHPSFSSRQPLLASPRLHHLPHPALALRAGSRAPAPPTVASLGFSFLFIQPFVSSC